MPKRPKMPVTMRALTQRVNRKLKPDLEMLRVTRGAQMQQDVGDYHVIDFRKNWITHKHVDPEQMARDMGVLHEWEEVA